MFGKRKRSEPVSTLADTKRYELHMKYLKARIDLYTLAKSVVVRQGVVSLYPDGPDRQQAIKDLEDIKYRMLSAIGTFDGLENDLRNFIKENEENFVTTKDFVKPPKKASSHTIVEAAYANCLGGVIGDIYESTD